MIAVDAMGGDNAPQAVITGAFCAAQHGVPVLLCGDEAQIISILNSLSLSWQKLPISIEHCTQVIEMAEDPVRAIMRKGDSSLVCAARSVAEGRSHAVVSAGNSGAVLAAGTLLIGRLEGVLRPAVGAFLPTDQGEVFCLDLGANTDCKAEFLVQFAHMGSVYVSLTKNISKPRIALLSNGHEPYKGSMEVKKAYEKLEREPELNFVGNIEGRDVFSGAVDVIVCDGFVGNIFLKTVQGVIRTFTDWIKKEASRSWWHTLTLALSRPVFKAIKQKTDYAKTGGALLLGVQAPIVLAHGCSQSGAIENAILFAHSVVKKKLITHFNAQLQLRFAASPSVQVTGQSNTLGSSSLGL